MKKILLTMAVAVLTVAASAQNRFYAGGSLGYGSNSYDGAITTSSFSILPEIGYVLNDKMTIGAELGYKSVSNKSHEPVQTDGTFSFNPYFRYTFFSVGKVDVFGDAMFSLGLISHKSSYKGSDTSTSNATSLGFYVKPGIAYNLNDKFSLVAKFGNVLGFSSARSGDSGAKATTAFELMNLSNKLAFGFYYNF